MFRELEVVGSLGCRRWTTAGVELARLGKVKVAGLVTHRFSLDEIALAFDALEAVVDPIGHRPVKPSTMGNRYRR
jgi:threonine dehydrogenase-like Zn-dependent dehydrogenase